ncbi:MAG: glycosyltransferase family 9 protein [Chthoniobacterales bacterium]
MPEKLFDRVLVIRGGALGDFLLTLPVLCALRVASRHLEILAYPQFTALAREAGLVAGGRSIEYGPLAGFFARGAIQDPNLRDYFATFDAALSYLYDPDGIFAENLRASGLRRFVAGPHKPESKGHAIDQLAAPLAELGVPMMERAADIRLPTSESRPPIVAIHPGSGSKTKNWPVAHWEALACELLATHPSIRLAIVGGEADGTELESLAKFRSHERVEFWQSLPLTALAGKLGGARGYIGHDTGVSHLAAVLGVPSLLLFGPSDPSVWAPPHQHVQILRAADGDLSELKFSTVLASAKRQIVPGLLA